MEKGKWKMEIATRKREKEGTILLNKPDNNCNVKV
jgi:hypothetical protein